MRDNHGYPWGQELYIVVEHELPSPSGDPWILAGPMSYFEACQALRDLGFGWVKVWDEWYWGRYLDPDNLLIKPPYDFLNNPHREPKSYPRYLPGKGGPVT